MFVISSVFASASSHAAGVTSGSSPIPFKHEAISSESDFGRVITGLLIGVLGLGGYVYFMRRRLGPSNTSTSKPKQLQIIDTQRLNPRTMLYVVEFAGAQYLLAHSEHGVSCLANAPIAPAAPAPIASAPIASAPIAAAASAAPREASGEK